MEARSLARVRQVVLRDPVPSLDGKRVRVRVDALDGEPALSSAEQIEAWHGWVESGPQGPIEDDANDWP